MIKEFVEQWWKHKDKLEAYFKNHGNLESINYSDIVKALLDNILNEGLKEFYHFQKDIHIIDDGQYEGTLLFVFHSGDYAPGIENYFFTYNYYGSCSGCDTLAYVLEGLEGQEQIDGLMRLAFDLLRSTKPMSDKVEYNGYPIHLTEEETK